MLLQYLESSLRLPHIRRWKTQPPVTLEITELERNQNVINCSLAGGHLDRAARM